MTGLPIRKKALPIVYGLATSMSCVLFATGSLASGCRKHISEADEDRKTLVEGRETLHVFRRWCVPADDPRLR